MTDVAVLVGSLRRESINRKFAIALGKLAGPRLNLRILDLSDVPMYNDDLWADVPEAVLRLKREIEAADAVLFVTPEYNRSFPAVMKNAIDWGTRPYGKNSFSAKPAGLVGTTPGATGTAAGQNHLKSVLNVADVVLMGQPEVYLTWKAEDYAADGTILNDHTREFLQRYVDRFVKWIDRTSERRTTAQADADGTN